MHPDGPDDELQPSDDTLAAFALIDAVAWTEQRLGGDGHGALDRARQVEPAVAMAALLEVAGRLALLAGEYGCGPDEDVRQAAHRLLVELRREFGRHGTDDDVEP